MNNDTTIGQNVWRIRRSHVDRLTQVALAAHLGVSPPTVQAYECGRIRIKADIIPAIATFLGCTIMDLYEGVVG